MWGPGSVIKFEGASQAPAGLVMWSAVKAAKANRPQYNANEGRKGQGWHGKQDFLGILCRTIFQPHRPHALICQMEGHFKRSDSGLEHALWFPINRPTGTLCCSVAKRPNTLQQAIFFIRIVG